MIKLVKFAQEDFETLKSWIKNPDDLLQFAGPIFSYPISDHQLLNYINDKRRIAYKVVRTDNNETIGHCELNLQNQLPRLSRILIGDEKLRNKGYGKLIVNEMLNLIFIQFGYDSVDLNVFDWNKGAIKCYEGIGFRINEGLDIRYNHKDKVGITKNMIIDKASWLNRNGVI